MILVCKHCGCDFKRKSRQQYCSHACALRHTYDSGTRTKKKPDPQKRVTRNCIECGNPFATFVSHGKTKICSAECRKHRWEREHPLVACKNCGMTFRAGLNKKGESKKRGPRAAAHQFCSPKCLGAYRTKLKPVTLHPSGYVFVMVDGQRVRQHRAVMERIMGRPLTDEENVHHKNGNKGDNRPVNLELWSVSQPSGQRVSDKVAWAVEFLKQYPDQLADAGYDLHMLLRIVGKVA